MSSLELRGLTVRFGHGRHAVTAVDGVDLEVPDGSVLGLVGESGSGKSTLGRAVAGLLPAASGRILLDGEDLDRRRHRVHLVFQDPYSSLDPRMTVGEVVAEGHRSGVPRRGRAAETARYLEMVGLDPARAASLPGALSGGQRQRVALARALATRPGLLIADEITSALDVSVQGAVLNLLRTLQRELGFSMLFISHDLAVVRYVSDAVSVMNAGRIVETGPVAQVLGDPRDPYTRTLIASIPRLTRRGPESGHEQEKRRT